MRIQKVVIRGFGPYADKVELDFENSLKDKSMFVITGNTGAGKTTIFDAINFVLYGEASGSDRDGKSLRSDFADPETPTDVELWFSLRGEDYYVKRNPSYMKAKSRGPGLTECAANAEFIKGNGKPVTGAGNVTREIEAVLGITSKQFRQLVMIPQGEFKQLLSAKSDEKEDIFRKIFGTEIFEKIEKKINEQANKLKNDIGKVVEDRLNKIRSFEFGDGQDELYRMAHADNPDVQTLLGRFSGCIELEQQQREVLKTALKSAETESSRIAKELALAGENNKKLEDMKNAETELEALKLQASLMAEQNQRLDRGKKAAAVKVFEDRYNEKHGELKKLKENLKEIEGTVNDFLERHKAAETEFAAQQARENEKNELVMARNENESLKKKVSEYEQSSDLERSLAAYIGKVRARVTEIQDSIQRNDKELFRIGNELETIGKANDNKGKLEKERINYENRAKRLSQLESGIDQLESYRMQHALKNRDFELLDKDFQLKKTEYERREEAFRRSQAGILARELKDGQPCPVCGSLHHPQIAMPAASDVTEESVNKGRELLENAREKRDARLNELTGIHSAMKATQEGLVGPLTLELLDEHDDSNTMALKVKLSNAKETNAAQIAKLAVEIAGLENMINKAQQHIDSKEKIENMNEALRAELQMKNEELGKEEGKLGAARKASEMIREQFKGEIKTAKEIEQTIKVLDGRLEALKNAYEKAEKEFNMSKTLLNQEEGKRSRMLEQQEKLVQQHDTAVEEFKIKSAEAGFAGYADYKAGCMSDADMTSCEKEINEYNMRRSAAESLHKAALQNAHGLAPMDTELLQKAHNDSEAAREKLLEDDRRLYARINNNSRILSDCVAYTRNIEKDEERYRVIGSLAAVATGNNARNISFERYVLADYFEDIIRAANLRFSKMTSGRFELLRKQDIGDKRKGQGLDTEVFDNYTGKARDVKTLSGGESFKASLSLALGLADVVQENAGGIQLDTMFIDEGFGTLDPESLDSAIECLMQLQHDGRLVGLISHVPELKERINVRLEVSATNTGSHAAFKC